MGYSALVSQGQSISSSAQSAVASGQSAVGEAQALGQTAADTASKVADAVQACFGFELSFSLNLFTGDASGFLPVLDIPDYLNGNPKIKALLGFVSAIYSTIMNYYSQLMTYVNNLVSLVERQYNNLMLWINTKTEDIMGNPCVKTLVGDQVPSMPSIGSVAAYAASAGGN